MQNIKTLLGDAFVYGLGTFFVKATQVFILPLILFYLEKGEFGTLDYFLNLKNILIIVYGWGTLTAIFKFADFSDSKTDNSAYIGFLVSISIVAVSSVIILLLAWIFEDIRAVSQNLLYVQLISVFGALMTIPMAVLRQRRQAISYIVINCIYSLVFLAVSYVLVSYTSLNYKSVLLGHIMAATCAFLFGTFLVRKWLSFNFDKVLFKKMFDFGFSVLLNSLAFAIILGTTRFFLKASGTFEDIGILGMALRLSLFVGALLIAPFTLAWLPFVKLQVNKAGFKETMNTTFRIFLSAGLLFCLSLELVMKDLFHFIDNKEYLTALDYVLPFSLSYFVQGLYFIFAAGIFVSGNTKHYRLIGLTGIAVNLVLYLIFYNQVNVLSVGLITLFSFAILAALAHYFGNGTLKIKTFSWPNIAVLSVYTVLLFFAVQLRLTQEYSIALFTTKIGVILTLFAFHFLMEKRALKKSE